MKIFFENSISSFEKEDGLGRCSDFAPGASNVGWSIEIIHSGSDGWIGEYVRTNILMIDYCDEIEIDYCNLGCYRLHD